MVLNGTERYRPVLNGIEWYLNGIPLADFYKVFYYSNISLWPNNYTIDIINGTLLNGIFGLQWYTVRLFVIIQNTIENW